MMHSAEVHLFITKFFAMVSRGLASCTPYAVPNVQAMTELTMSPSRAAPQYWVSTVYGISSSWEQGPWLVMMGL
jgi:hypothetical protein